MTQARDIRDVLDPLLATFDVPLEAELTGALTDTYASGSAQMVTWGKTQAGIPIAYEGPPMEKAIVWAQQHSARLVTQMDMETKDRLADVIGRAIKDKRGVDGLGRDIRREIQDMSVRRGKLIARTETASALSQGSLDAMKDMGIQGKEWVTVGDDRVSDECQANEDQGVIPVNQAFVSGAMAPPQHPDCRCSLAPVMMKPKEPIAKEPVAKTPAGPSLDMSSTAPAPDLALPKGVPKGVTTQTSKARAWETSLAREPQWGLDRWRASSYEVMKKAQVSGRGPEPVMRALKQLDTAIAAAPRYDGAIYRGMTNLSEAAMKKLANAKTLTMKAHTSFSAAPDIARGFAVSTKASPTANSVFMSVERNVGGRLITAEVKGELEVLVQKGVQYAVVERKIERLSGQNVLHMVLREVV